ncbi:MAG: DUF1858 domain-containing protein [Patescibacteria group bacterium]|jgi:hybrid cluster-associated redox disulfide protein
MITKDTLISKAVEEKPETVDVLVKHGLPCVGCLMAHGETIEQGCMAHGLDDKKIKEIIDEINKK